MQIIRLIAMKKTEFLKIIGKRIKEQRLAKGLSQEELAELASLHRTYIGIVERGEKNITLFNLYRISEALGVDINKILKLKD
jgi:transcriptional regulator with XRE-family HTH domain